MKWTAMVVAVLALANGACAQGLLWSLPDDGSWVRYEGTYTQMVRRPDSSAGDLTLEWRRNVTIKSVGREEHAYALPNQPPAPQPCRWIELKVETGRASEGVLDAGPGGIRMYKLLVPESAIKGATLEDIGNGRTMFISYIPFVKGYRKLGDEPAQELSDGVFQLYPVVSLLRHYRDFESGGQESASVPAGSFTCERFNGNLVMETPVKRSTNSCELFRSDEVPFGVAKWTATSVSEKKGSTDPRSEFEPNVTIKEELQAVSIGRDAESEFLVN